MRNSFGTRSPAFIGNLKKIFSVAPIAYWNFENIVSGQFPDLVAGTYPITVTGSVSIASSTFSGSSVIAGTNCGKFNRSSASYTASAPDTTMTPGSSNTLAGWFRFHAFVTGNPAIFGKDTGGADYTLVMVGSDLRFYGLTGGNSTVISSVALDTWYHFAVVYDGSNGNTGLYINGSLVTTFAGSSGPRGSGTPLYIVSDPVFGDRTSDINLDEWALFNQKLNSTQVSEIYNLGLSHIAIK